MSEFSMLGSRAFKYSPIGGSYIPTPKSIVNKKAIINVKNNDENCFLYSILAHIKKFTINRVNKYKRMFTHPYKTVQGSVWDCEHSYLSGNSILSAATLPPRLCLFACIVFSSHNTTILSCIATLLKDIVHKYFFEFNIHIKN